jgi:hypothetical protein
MLTDISDRALISRSGSCTYSNLGKVRAARLPTDGDHPTRRHETVVDGDWPRSVSAAGEGGNVALVDSGVAPTRRVATKPAAPFASGCVGKRRSDPNAVTVISAHVRLPRDREIIRYPRRRGRLSMLRFPPASACRYRSDLIMPATRSSRTRAPFWWCFYASHSQQ